MYDPQCNFLQGGWDGYRQFFPNIECDQLRFEATVHSLFQECALDAWSRLDPQPQIVVVVRRPSEQVRSAFYFARNDFLAMDQSLDFADFVELLLNDRFDELKAQFSNPKAFDVLARALADNRLVDWIDRWVERIDQPLHVVDFDELAAHPAAVVMSICDQLSIDRGHFEGYQFKVANRTTHLRFPGLHSALRQIAATLPSRQLKASLRSIYRRAQLTSSANVMNDRDRDAMRRLEEYFRPWNRQLSERYRIPLDR